MTKALTDSTEAEAISKPTRELLAYCRKYDWAGVDPYDGLNSRLFNATPLKRSRLCRLAFIQLLKRLPVDLRPLLLIPREANAKAMALFLMAALRLRTLGLGEDGLPAALLERLKALRSPGSSYWCWGYNFPWQTRTVLVPKGAPNLVSTVFAAEALLEAYHQDNDMRCAEMAVSAAEYLLRELFWSDSEEAGFSYPLPGLRTRVHNANFLAAALLGRVYKLCGEEKFRGAALAAARYSAGRQAEDGSWPYGDAGTQGWIDNFHTGYNLCALHSIGRSLATDEFDGSLRSGLAFYRQRFFTESGAVRYFHDRSYPIDTHCVAQSVITLTALRGLDAEGMGTAAKVLEWTLANMRDREGYFYYQSRPLMTNRISYMRWSQAWMLLALSTYLSATLEEDERIASEAGASAPQPDPKRFRE